MRRVSKQRRLSARTGKLAIELQYRKKVGLANHGSRRPCFGLDGTSCDGWGKHRMTLRQLFHTVPFVPARQRQCIAALFIGVAPVHFVTARHRLYFLWVQAQFCAALAPRWILVAHGRRLTPARAPYNSRAG